MTILQLKYVIAIAGSSSMREAASRLFVSQPALSQTIRELEEELDIQLFERTNKGIHLTEEGRDFLIYAKQAVSQYELIEDRYLAKEKEKKHFSVSMQHWVFAVHAFVRTVKQFDTGKYTFAVHETKTDEVLNNVRNLKSEFGIFAFSKNNEKIVKKLLREYQLEFTPLLVRDTYAYVWKTHPLAGCKELSVDDLKDYPCISFDQNSEHDFYLPEEALTDYKFDKLITSNDRATTAELMASLNGYSIGTGIMISSLALKDDCVCIKLKEEDPLTIGYIVRKNHNLSDIGKVYLEELLKYKEITQ